MEPKLENIAKSEATEYRIITANASVDSLLNDKQRFLQFRSEKTVRGFPDFWNKYKKQVWRFIPHKRDIGSNYFEQSVYEENCPISLSFPMSYHLVSCYLGQENYPTIGLIDFTKNFPNISDYFIHANKLRKKYLRKEKERNEHQETAYL